MQSEVGLTNGLIDTNIQWLPLYPNNMKCNGINGYYCIMSHKHQNGTVSARKYTILFQHEEINAGTGLINPQIITHYILFEKTYTNIVGPLSYNEPSDKWIGFAEDNTKTFNAYDINSYGSFVYAYHDLETAKQRAMNQWKHIYGYVMSFLPESQR